MKTILFSLSSLIIFSLSALMMSSSSCNQDDSLGFTGVAQITPCNDAFQAVDSLQLMESEWLATILSKGKLSKKETGGYKPVYLRNIMMMKTTSNYIYYYFGYDRNDIDVEESWLVIYDCQGTKWCEGIAYNSPEFACNEALGFDITDATVLQNWNY